MSRQAVFAHSGNVPDVGGEKLAVKRLSWMGATKTESVIVTFEDGNRVAQAEEARKQREKIMGNIRMQLSRINEMLESPARTSDSRAGSQQQPRQIGDREPSQQQQQHHSPSSAMSTARSRQADPKQLISYLDGTCHSRFSIANYNAYVRAKMIEIMEANPPNSAWPILPTDEEFPVPSISEGTGVSPSNVTSAPTWRDMLGGRGTIGYNTKASACAKELLSSFEPFQNVNFGDGFNDKASTVAATAAAADSNNNNNNNENAAVTSTSEQQQQQQPVAAADESATNNNNNATSTAAAAPPQQQEEKETARGDEQQQQQQQAPSAEPAAADNAATGENTTDAVRAREY